MRCMPPFGRVIQIVYKHWHQPAMAVDRTSDTLLMPRLLLQGKLCTRQVMHQETTGSLQPAKKADLTYWTWTSWASARAVQPSSWHAFAIDKLCNGAAITGQCCLGVGFQQIVDVTRH